MDLFLSLERKFKAASDKEVSKQQEAYLRHHFKCYGIKSLERRMLYKELIKAAKRQAKIDWQLLDKCWQSDYREYHHFVLDYLLAMSQFITYNDCSRLEFYARHQQWWDSIDVLTKVFGNLSLKDDKVMNLLSEWSLDQDFWMRRLAIEHQLGFKEKTNTDILSLFILRNTGSQEFFINKAIGWALRDYSKYNKVWVKDFISNHYDELSTLSIREGSKYL